MRNPWCVLWLVLATVCSTAQAEVLAAASGGFKLQIVTHTRADPLLAYQAFVRVDQWWHPDHSYSGDAANLSLEMTPGGAFLEKLDGGGFGDCQQRCRVH